MLGTLAVEIDGVGCAPILVMRWTDGSVHASYLLNLDDVCVPEWVNDSRVRARIHEVSGEALAKWRAGQ